jgi:hypothetical protein
MIGECGNPGPTLLVDETKYHVVVFVMAIFIA